MTPQELKASILQLAIQGKLVEQRPEEGTGEELYQQIQEKKQKLIKDGKIKKGKSLPEITVDEIPFDIPENWIWVRLGTIVKSISAGGDKPSAFSKNKSTEYTVPVISNGETNKGIYGYTNKAEILERSLTVSGRGTIGYAEIRTEPFLPIVRLLVIIPLEHTYLEYIKVAIQASAEYGIGSAVKQLTVPMISPKLIPLPPLAEQQRIVAKIEELLPYIDRYEKMWSRLEDLNKRFPVDMQKSILQMAIQGKLVEQRPEEGTGEDVFQRIKPYHKELKPCKDELDFSSMDFDIPESWTMVELNQLFDFVDYRGKTPTKISEGVFLITASNIRRAYMDYTRKEYISREEYEGRQSRGITQKGDLLFTTEAPMGNAALCDLDECSCGQRIITFKEYTEETVSPALFMYFILSPQFQQQLLDNCTGTTAKGIKADKLKHFLLPLPPYEEQKRIVAKLEEILPLCEKLK